MALNRGTLFQPEIVQDLVSKVQGKSSLAVLAKQAPIPFNGSKEFTFTMDSEIDIVAESGAKSHGGVTVSPITIVPIKVEYGARVSDEFMYAAEEERLNILKAFNDGFAKKVARGLDLMAFHGVNPRSGAASAVIGANHVDAQVNQLVTYNSANPDANVEDAVKLVRDAGADVTGLVASPAFSSALAAYKIGGVRQFPELAWGANPGTVNGLALDVNKTVSDAASKDRAILGDFANAFKWGYAKEIPMEVIQYGDPDNSGNDLKGYNQVYLRAEVYLGWAVLDPVAFARIVDATVVTFTAAQVGGTTQAVASTAIAITFSADVVGLTADKITLTDGTGKAVKGALTGSGKNWSLAITGADEGNVTLAIADFGGFDVTSTAATVAVYSA
jgi:hypothetical protein